MENLIADERGVAVPAVDGTVVGRHGIVPVRVVWALPVLGREIMPVRPVAGVGQLEVAPSLPFLAPPGFTDAFPVGRSGLAGGPFVVVAGRRRVYVSRLVSAVP